MKDEKDLLQENQPKENTDKKETAMAREKRTLNRRAIMVLVSGLIVVAVLVAVGIAWYTRIVNSYSVTFEVADYDLAINNDQEEFKLDIYEYSEVVKRKMAPGTIGWFPLNVSAKHSQVDVSFTIALENLMPEKIAKHFRIYALQKAEPDGSGGYTYNLYYGDALPKAEDVYAKIPGTDEPLYKKLYIDSKETVINDVMPKNSDKTICFYWEWYLDAERANADHIDDSDVAGDEFEFYYDDTNKATRAAMDANQWAAAKLLWDDLDTDIGRYPEKYKKAMMLVLHTTGAQAKPQNGIRPEPETTTEPTTTN